MKAALLAAMGLALAVAAPPSRAAPSSLAPADFAKLGFDQKPGAQVPLDLVLTDESGTAVPLHRFFHGVPVLLVLDYLHCPGLCGLVLGNLAQSLGKASLAPGRDVEILAVSFDPHETPADAARAKAEYEARFGTAARWHFLTGSKAAIAGLTNSVGFRYRFDPAIGQFAHPSGLTVLTATGTVSRYLLGVEAQPLALRLAVTEAGEGAVAAPAAHLLLLCFSYDPRTGRYTPLVMRLTEIACAATALALAGGVSLALWREHRRRRAA